MLDHITIEGFRSIRSIEKLAMRPVNVLIGANGSGKSNLLEAFSFLQGVREFGFEGGFREHVARAGGAERLLHFGSKRTKELHFDLSFEPGVRYELKLVPIDIDRLYPSVEAVHPPDQTWVRDRISGWRLYHFQDTSSSSLMKKTARLHDNRYLRADGANLASYLYFLRERHRDSYDHIRETVRLTAPFFVDFQLEPVQVNPDTILLEWRHRNTDQYFNASELSDGTLRFMALATLFLQPIEFRPSLILVDEPELGLHPYAIELLAALIKEASFDSQVIVSTQSPRLVDHFDPEDVLVADLVDGATQIRRLDSSQLAAWLEEYSLGELWEKNEFGGRPVRG